MLDTAKAKTARILSASLVLSLALMAGRLAGFGRELVLASSLGLSAEADLAVLLLTLPDLLVNLLLSGGLAIALVPALHRAGPAGAGALFRQSSLLVGLLFSALGLVIGLFPQLWLQPLAPGLAVPADILGSGLLLVLGMSLPLSALAGVSSAALQSQQKFFVAGCGTLFFNLCVIAGLLGAAQFSASPLVMLCWSILAGTALRWLSQMAAMPGSYIRQASPKRYIDGALLRAFATGLLSASLLILVPVIVRSFASLLGPGQIAAFNYANKLIELPLGILITTLATVAYPKLCELYGQGDSAAAARTLAAALSRGLILSLCVLGTGLWSGDAIVALLLQRGKIDAQGAAAITTLLHIALLSVPLVAVSSLAAAALNARQQTGRVLLLTLAALLSLVLFCIPGLLQQSAPQLMWAMVGFHAVFAGLLLWQLRSAGVAGRLPLETKILPGLGFSGLVCLAGAALDGQLAGFAPWLRALLAVFTFGLAAFVGLRCLRSSTSPTSPAA